MTFDRHPAIASAPRRPGRSTGGLRLIAGMLAAVALAGCASPPSHFYTLSPGDTTAPAVANPPLMIELAPVDMPAQVAKNQFVVQRSASEVDVLEQERWASLPGDEVRRALSGDLTRRLGTIDVYGAPHPEGVPVYRIGVNVQRFESWPGSHALIDAVWSVRSLATQNVMTCRSVLTEPVGAGYGPLVDGHRRAVDALSASIATGVDTLARASRHVGGTISTHGTAAAASVPCPATLAPAQAGGTAGS